MYDHCRLGRKNHSGKDPVGFVLLREKDKEEVRGELQRGQKKKLDLLGFLSKFLPSPLSVVIYFIINFLKVISHYTTILGFV